MSCQKMSSIQKKQDYLVDFTSQKEWIKVVKITILTWHGKYNTNSDRKIIKLQGILKYINKKFML